MKNAGEIMMRPGLTRIAHIPREAPGRLEARAVSAPKVHSEARILSSRQIAFTEMDEIFTRQRLAGVREGLAKEKKVGVTEADPGPDPLLMMIMEEEENARKKKRVVNIVKGAATLMAKFIEMLLVPESQRVVGKGPSMNPGHDQSSIDKMMLYAKMKDKARSGEAGMESAPTDKLLAKARSAQTAKSFGKAQDKSSTDSTVKSK